MKDVATILRKKYYDTISALTVSSVAIPVYDTFIPDNAPINYCLIDVQTESKISNKTARIVNATVTINIVHWQQRSATRKTMENYSNPIMQAIDGVILNLGPDFEMVSSKFTGTNSTASETQEKVYSTKSITFEHIIIQL